MNHQYYYLVSGLPDIALDDARPLPDLIDFINDMIEQVMPEDREYLRILRMPRDNDNLIRLQNNTHTAIIAGGNYSKDDLLLGLKFPDTLPSHMERYLDAYSDRGLSMSHQLPEDILAGFFYDWVCEHPNTFIANWFSFDLNLRNFLAGLNARLSGKNVGDVVIGSSDIAQTMRHSQANDFSLSSQFPWVEKFLSLMTDSPLEYEHVIVTLQWDILNELTTFAYFRIDSLLSHAIRLNLASRWKKLTSGQGRESFDAITNTIKESFQFSNDFQTAGGTQ